jgi:hypothetical protein
LSQRLALLAWPNDISARPAHATGAARACPSGGHRARVEHSGAPTGGPPAVRLAPQAPARYGSLAGQGHGDADAMERRGSVRWRGFTGAAALDGSELGPSN